MASRLYLQRGPGHPIVQGASLAVFAVVGFVVIVLGAVVLSIFLTGALVVAAAFLARRWWLLRKSEALARRQGGNIIDAQYQVVSERAPPEERDR
jgi:hypothetical protein